MTSIAKSTNIVIAILFKESIVIATAIDFSSIANYPAIIIGRISVISKIPVMRRFD
jgi:hypothetical protein